MKLNYEIVDRAKKGCKFCGSTNVTWRENNEGRWYLTEVFEIDGETRSSPQDFHSLYCTSNRGMVLDHEKMQRELDGKNEDDERERTELRKRQEDADALRNAEEFIAWASMDHERKLKEISILERQMDSFYRNPPTMDYMKEYGDAMREHQERQTAWKFLKALVGDPQEENYKS